ncbi:MAG: hypothetical protein FJY77_01025 [Candidatus Altiarchaeales archaeon]|nr:hypothetical protein [Candidatus Altiarchaeales archaeon]
MKDFKDVTPTEKKRESKISREKKLEEEPKGRRKKKELSVAEEKALEVKEVKPEAKVEEAKAEEKKEVKEKPKEKKPKPKPVEKIKYHVKKEVPELKLEKRKPKFRRQEHYKHRLDNVWRKATGIDSKQHEGKRGKGFKPSIGYKNPNVIQSLHPLGYKPVVVHNVQELAKLDSRNEGAVIASAVGRRKRNQIIAEANKLKIVILNPRKGET